MTVHTSCRRTPAGLGVFSVVVLACLIGGWPTAATAQQALTYPIVDTGQTRTYDNSGEITPPEEGAAFYGQDAQYDGNQPRYADNGDGTVTDLVTGLMWSSTPDLNGDGAINAEDKLTYEEAIASAKTFNLAGYDDWRLPTIKELYSLIHFDGNAPTRVDGSDGRSVHRHGHFAFGYGDTSGGRARHRRPVRHQHEVRLHDDERRRHHVRRELRRRAHQGLPGGLDARATPTGRPSTSSTCGATRTTALTTLTTTATGRSRTWPRA